MVLGVNTCTISPCWHGDSSTVGGQICSAQGLTSLSFPLQGSRGAKGAKVSLWFCTIYSLWMMPGGIDQMKTHEGSSWKLFFISG